MCCLVYVHQAPLLFYVATFNKMRVLNFPQCVTLRGATVVGTFHNEGKDIEVPAGHTALPYPQDLHLMCQFSGILCRIIITDLSQQMLSIE